MTGSAAPGSADLLDLYLADLLLDAPRRRTHRRGSAALAAAAALLAIPAATLLAVQLTSRPGAPASASGPEDKGPYRTESMPARMVADLPPRARVTATHGGPDSSAGVSRNLGGVRRHPAIGVAIPHPRAVSRAVEPDLLTPAPPALPAYAGKSADAEPAPIIRAAAKLRREERQDAIDAIRTLRSQ